MSGTKPREKTMWHMSVNARQAKKNYESFLETIGWAIKNAPSTVKFTCPEVQSLEAKVKELEVELDAWKSQAETLAEVLKTRYTNDIGPTGTRIDAEIDKALQVSANLKRRERQNE